jgi:uncharacterized protein
MRMVLGTLLISALAHLSALLWAERAFPKCSRLVLRSVALGLALLAPISRALYHFTPTESISFLSGVSVFELAVLASGTLLLVPLLFLARAFAGRANALTQIALPSPASDAAAGSSAAGSAAAGSADAAEAKAPAGAPTLFPRRILLTRTAGVLAYGVPAGVLGWGARFGRHDYRIEEFVARIPGLPKTLEGYTLAQISDIHTGLFVGPAELRDAVRLLNSVGADAVVLTGDLVDNDARHTSILASAFSDLRARDGVYGIVGNHDHFAGADAVERELERSGIRMLVNKTAILRPQDQGGIALVGVDDFMGLRLRGRGPRFGDALRGVSPGIPRVLLAHQPDYVDWISGQVALQLSGHTHGGQINLGLRPIDLVYKRVAGAYEENGTTLYVNRGFGVVGPPARIQAPPEITKITLVGA